MRIMLDGTAYHISVRGQGKPLVCFHGFSESGNTWDDIEVPGYTMYRVDFIGHGQSDRPMEKNLYEWDTVLTQLHQIIWTAVGERYALMGYSMGARIALGYALQYGNEVEALILESGSVGLADIEKRQARVSGDALLGEFIVREGIEAFEERWCNLDIFKSQLALDKRVRERIRCRRLHNSPHALALTLSGTGQGAMPYVGNRLEEISCPALYISGALDTKYTGIGETVFARVKTKIGGFHHVIIPDAGHNVHLERPKLFGESIRHFFKNEVQ